jgi:hypothetical protein
MFFISFLSYLAVSGKWHLVVVGSQKSVCCANTVKVPGHCSKRMHFSSLFNQYPGLHSQPMGLQGALQYNGLLGSAQVDPHLVAHCFVTAFKSPLQPPLAAKD